jgi:hypothetical protein
MKNNFDLKLVLVQIQFQMNIILIILGFKKGCPWKFALELSIMYPN